MVKNVTAKEIPSLLGKPGARLVIKIWSKACGPCKGFASPFEEASKNFTHRPEIQFLALDLLSEGAAEFCADQGVGALPTVLVMRRGYTAPRTGSCSQDELEQFIVGHLDAYAE